MADQAGDDVATPDSADTREDIMSATFRALCRHGYADLTMQNIADEFDKSKSLLHYHYDSKEDLLLAFLEHAIGWISDRVEESDAESAPERLREYVDRLAIQPDHDGSFVLALYELRMRAVHNEAFRTRLAAHYRRYVDDVAEIVADGVEQGQFRQVDPHATAEMICAAMEGGRMREVVLGVDGASLAVRDAIEDQFLPPLRTEDGA